MTHSTDDITTIQAENTGKKRIQPSESRTANASVIEIQEYEEKRTLGSYPIQHVSDHEVNSGSSGGGDDNRLSDCDALTTTGDDPEAGNNRGAGRISILSRLSSAIPEDPGPPPDGGWAAWITCICTHMVFANTWGFINSFGIFQTYYADFLAPLPPSTISWIGSVQVFLSFFLSAITGRLSDAGYYGYCYGFGAFFMVLGLFGTSFCNAYWQLMLAQGLCIGLAAGLLCCPTMSIVSTYFHKKRSFAIGIISCGNVSGGLVYPAMARQLLPSIGFAWTLRAMGFMQLGMLLIAGLVIRPRLRPKVTGAIFDFHAFLEPEFTLYVVGMAFNLGGTFIIYYYIASFGRGVVGLSYPESLNLLLIFNGIGIVGRLSASYSADHVGPLNIMYIAAFASAVCCYAWVAVHSRGGIYGWIAVYGVIAGSLQALFPAGLSSLTPDMSKIGQRIGLGFTFIGVSVIAGPPAAGAMVTAMNGSYLGAQVFAASLLVVGGSLIVAAKVVRIRRTHSRWLDKI